MRTITKTTDVYSFDELSENAKQKAIDKLYDINTSYDWYDHTYYDASEVGLKITSFDIDIESYCNAEFIESSEATAHKIIREHGEHCETHKTAYKYLSERNELIEQAPKDENGDFEDEYELDSSLDELDEQFNKDLSEDYLKMLREEYEYQSSEEAIIDTIEANEYEFTEDGDIY